MIEAKNVATPQMAIDLADSMNLLPLVNGSVSPNTGVLTVVTGYTALFLFELNSGGTKLGAIDAGWEFSATIEMLKAMGIDYKTIVKIMLSHGHEDHVGLLQEKGSSTEYHLGIEDLGVVLGEKPSEGEIQRQRDLDMGPGKFLAEVESQNVKILEPYVELELGENIRILPIPVPGHTSGSFMFDLKVGEKSDLIVGDALVFGRQGQIIAPPAFLSGDSEKSEEVIKYTVGEYVRDNPNRLIIPSHSAPRTGEEFLSVLPKFRPDLVA